MATTIATAAINAAADAVVDILDTGSADATGDLEIETSGQAVLVTCLFANPAFGSAAEGVATANAIGQGTATGAGTAAECDIRDRDNGNVIEGSVTAPAGGGEIELTNLVIAVSDTVDITAMTYTQPAS